jgi:uncharacterized membrane protein
MDALVTEWIGMMLRWLHVIAGIAWIGSSFYFVHLDLSLRKHDGLPTGVGGDTWQVHGGGFYHMQKYLVAPAQMPEDLTWFKWEAYATWISGFLLLAAVYYTSADLYLIDQGVLDLTPATAVIVSLVLLAAGWIAYDLLCRSPVGKNDVLLMLVGFALLVGISWGCTQIFSGRGAYIQIGAIVGTIMAANVLMVIIPNQRKTVASLLAHEDPDPRYGIQAKQRSLHNNYLTLPVLFLMISNHYPMNFATQWNWLIAGVVIVMGVSIRHFFNSQHAHKGSPWWTWGVTAAGGLLILWLNSFPVGAPAAMDAAGLENDETFVAVEDVVLSRCSMCHAEEPVWEGVPVAPLNVRLETPADILREASRIESQSVLSRAMPPGNITEMTEEERHLIAAWLAKRKG